MSSLISKIHLIPLFLLGFSVNGMAFYSGEEVKTKQYEQFVDGVFSGLNSHDLQKVTSYFSQDARFHGWAPEVLNVEGYVQAMSALISSFPDAKFIVEQTISENNKIVVHHRFEGTHTGSAFQAISPLGKKAVASATVIFDMVGNKARELWLNADFLGLINQIRIPSPKINHTDHYLTILRSSNAQPELYHGARAKLESSGVWEKGWEFHAIGSMNPSGLFSIGLFPDEKNMMERIAASDQVFKQNEIPAPVQESYKIHNLVYKKGQAIPKEAIMIFHEVHGMTAVQYESILRDLGNDFWVDDLLFHACIYTEHGLQVIDIWNSPASLEKFASALMPILQDTFGFMPPPPAMYQVFNSYQK